MNATMAIEKTTTKSVNHATGFLEVLARRNFDELERLFAPNVWFRVLLPRRIHESTNAAEAIEALRGWFGETRDFRVLALDQDTVANREFVSYRFLLRPDWAPEQWHVIEQVGFLRAKEDRISRLDLVCTGFFPSDEAGRVLPSTAI